MKHEKYIRENNSSKKIRNEIKVGRKKLKKISTKGKKVGDNAELEASARVLGGGDWRGAIM